MTTSVPSLDINIHDDDTADVLGPRGSLVDSLTPASEGDGILSTIQDYVREQARLLETPVLVRISRAGYDEPTRALVNPDGSFEAAEDATPPDEQPRVDEPAGTVDEGAHTADLELDDLGDTTEEPVAEDPFVDTATPAAPPAGPIQVGTGGSVANAQPTSGWQHSDHHHRARGEEEASPFRGTEPGRPSQRPERKRGVGPHVPPPPQSGGGEGRWSQLWHRHRTPLLAIGLVGLIVVVGLGVLAGSLVGGTRTDGPPVDPAQAMSTPDPASDEVECPTRTDGAVSTGRDPGDQTSGPNVIKAFDYAYYQWRSGTAARAMVSANGKVGSAIDIQTAIDVLDPQLRYCLAITDQGNNVYGVELTEIPTAGQRRIIRQEITTTEIGGKHWIAAIARPKTER